MTPRQSSRNQRPLRALWIAALSAVAFVGLSVVAARAGDDDNNDDGLTFEQRILQNFMRGMGLRDGTESGIDYRERSPLVIPPNRDLPPPQVDNPVAQNPAWPKDPDVQRRKAEIAKRKNYQGEDPEVQARNLRPDELNKGRLAPGTGKSAGPSDPDPGHRLTTSELGYKGGLFGSIFKSNDDEVGTFTGEPPRTSLVEPPVGYQTPSPDQPYGLGKTAVKPKAYNPKDKGLEN